jgi:hypothetical protein
MAAKERNRQLKQYFTPPRVARFMLRFAAALEPALARGPVAFVDPACGEGVFLKEALEQGLTTPSLCLGIDRDAGMPARWAKEPALLQAQSSLRVGDALAMDVEPSFRLAAGNPPFGLAVLSPGWAGEHARFSLPSIVFGAGARTFPLELLFLERFMGLLKPGGLAAVVLPVGVFTNHRLAGARDWLASRFCVKGIVFIESPVFGGEGTTARTGILFAANENPGGRVFWASVSRVDRDGDGPDHLSDVMECFKRGEGRLGPGFAAFFSSPDLLRDGRWDPLYHHPAHARLMEEMQAGGFPLCPLGELLGKQGIITGYKGPQEKPGSAGTVPFVTSRHVRPPFIDLSRGDSFVAPGGRADPQRSRIREGDVLLVRSGEGCIGRAAVARAGDAGANLRSEVYLLRLSGDRISPGYLTLFLACFRSPLPGGRKPRLAHFQVCRLARGVGTPNLGKREIASILVPIIPPEARERIDMRLWELGGQGEGSPGQGFEALRSDLEDYLSGRVKEIPPPRGAGGFAEGEGKPWNR